jgi:hypothetical protein
LHDRYESDAGAQPQGQDGWEKRKYTKPERECERMTRERKYANLHRNGVNKGLRKRELGWEDEEKKLREGK